MNAAKQQQRQRRRSEQADSSSKKETGTKHSHETNQLPSILTVKTHQESIAMQYAKNKNTNLKRRVPNAGGLGNKMDTSVQDATTLKSSPKQKSASFVKYNSVTIREYSIIPGDNPSVSKGVPLAIDWDHQWERTFDLDAYEKGRKPRHQIEMKVPAELRSELLRKNGHSWKDIQASIKMANIARRQRTKTIERLPSDKIDEKLEKIARGVKNIFKEKKKKPDTKSGKEKKNDDISGISNCAQVHDEEINSKRKDDIDISLSKSAKNYDLSSLGSESRGKKQPNKQDLVCILSEDLSECQSMDEQSGISLGTSSVMEMKDHDQNANVTSSDRSDPSNDTSSTEDIDVSNHSLLVELSQDVDKNMKSIPWFHSSMKTSKKVSDREHKKKSRKNTPLKMLEYGSEYNSEESEKDVEIDVCCGGAFGRAGKLLQASRVKQDIF